MAGVLAFLDLTVLAAGAADSVAKFTTWMPSGEVVSVRTISAGAVGVSTAGAGAGAVSPPTNSATWFLSRRARKLEE
jgi:hypothetical protein